MEDAFKVAEILDCDIKDLFLCNEGQESHTNTA
ncbi:hypothetical protein MOC35_17915 [Bacillus inaquosorum]|nr:hypothetical protein [Bacillus inaquosorum]